MTTLLSMGLRAQDQLKKELESRGLRLSAADLAALIEEVSPAASRAALSSALDFLKPFTSGLGLRVSRLTDAQIEMVIPARSRNLNESGFLHEGVLSAAAVEACKMMWSRHAPLGTFQVETKSLQMQILRGSGEEARIRWELPETLREKTLSQLRQEREASVEASLRVIDGQEQALAEITLRLQLTHVPALDSSKA